MQRQAVESLEIRVGARMILEPVGWQKQIKTSFIGMVKEKYILAELPMQRDVVDILGPDVKVTVRYMHEGLIYGFSAEVINLITKPYPMLFLTYPQVVDVLRLRKHDRVACFLPAVVRLHELGPDSPQTHRAIVANLSAGGCRMSVDMPEPRNVPSETKVECILRLFSSKEETRLAGVVRSCQVLQRKVDLGVQFDSLSGDVQRAINTYIQHVQDNLSE